MKSKTHRISIPTILDIKKGNSHILGEILESKQIKNVLIFIDEYMHSVIGERLRTSLMNWNIKHEIHVLKHMEFEDMGKLAYQISGSVEAVIGVGGGRVLDLTKYICYLRKKPFISVPTASSNDGFSSPVASIYVSNRRTTVPAKVPYGVIVDIDLIKDSPDIFIYSGIGDSVSNITAVWDMEFESQHRDIEIDTVAKMMSIYSIDVLLKYKTSNIKDGVFLTKLLETLTMSGISMEISGSSSPASGSEHLISHAMDKILEDKNYPHGIQVGIATYIISKLQNNRNDEINDFLLVSGFWDCVKQLKIKKESIIAAIHEAPSIKPYRKTIIHLDEKRSEAINIVKNDEILDKYLV